MTITTRASPKKIVMIRTSVTEMLFASYDTESKIKFGILFVGAQESVQMGWDGKIVAVTEDDFARTTVVLVCSRTSS